MQPSVNGWLIPAGSAEGLAAALRQALQMPVAELEQMGKGKAGAERAAAMHDATKEAAKLAGLFRQVAGGG